MRILVLSSRFPYPTEKGDKLRLFNQIRGLAVNHEIHLFSISDEEVTDESLKMLGNLCETISVQKISKIGSYLNVALGLFDKVPFQCKYFYRSAIQKKLDKLVQSVKPDLIFCQLVRMAEYGKRFEVPKVIDLMDAFSLNMKRRSDFENGIKRMFFKNEARRISSYELNISSFFDSATIISQPDKEYIVNENVLLNDKLHVVSNGLDTEYFSNNKPKTSEDGALVFVGNMGYHPNILAAEYIAKKIMPDLGDHYKLIIAGTRPSQRVKNLSANNIQITGWMKDIRDAYKKADIFVAPIFSGAGQQNKILEAMSMGLCCVTTSSVNKAIGGEEEKHLLIANSKVEFVNQIIKLSTDEVLRNKMSKEARKFVLENYSWSSANQELEKILVKTLSGNK